MAAQPNHLSVVSTKPGDHKYYAKADVFSAELELPIQRTIAPEALVQLEPGGQYQYQPAGPLQVEGIFSYRSGYTQVAGHPSTKLKGFTTLATSVVEGLNVLDVITADRVVGQISTVHPNFRKQEGQVPSVTFLGTRFENLRIGGHKIEIEPHLDILGAKPDEDESYFNNGGVLSRIAHQYANIRRITGLPQWASDQFSWNQSEAQSKNEMKCALVNSVSGAPGTSFGHVIDLPHFGRIFLGELTVNRQLGNGASNGADPTPDTYEFHLTMIRLEMGCLAQGTSRIVALDTNGGGSKGGPQPVAPPPPPPPYQPTP
jgi:hypothetical protein